MSSPLSPLLLLPFGLSPSALSKNLSWVHFIPFKELCLE